MDITDILNELKRERDRIDAAISALGDSTISGKRGYRRSTGMANGRRRRRRLSVAARKRISEAAKARWAKAKRAGKTSL